MGQSCGAVMGDEWERNGRALGGMRPVGVRLILPMQTKRIAYFFFIFKALRIKLRCIQCCKMSHSRVL